MKEWNEPVLDELNVSETMKGHHNGRPGGGFPGGFPGDDFPDFGEQS